ncbi:DUF3341 domain-containing protein [Verrucomicrobiales bacterium]|nr:DUF3341 domain-containing protein [Verrucomicrobiales bacterium]MDA9923837.1 DUF3341 domain-containing protein [Verrucomicrobiales bacterium]MDB2495819.1 DUF3341 domain-containing protein [Verrucomicrobiales bacterium]MDB3939802.1 DUF3341 domain-containing protein [Verrucomicrobiales bacterium]MDC0262768.1 DUF3341 domain-containing protein [Verrucomicrobiales bacterium]
MSTATDKSSSLFGYVAEFSSASELYHAAEKIRDAGFRRWDVHTPYPVHGMDHAMGLGKSWLSAVVLCGGATGSFVALFLQFFTQVSLYPTVVQNKPTNLFTIPAFFPVTFELTILLAAFATLFGLLIFIMLPRWNHPLFNSKLFPKFSDDGFIMVVEARDPKFKKEETRDFLKELGAGGIEEVAH